MSCASSLRRCLPFPAAELCPFPSHHTLPYDWLLQFGHAELLVQYDRVSLLTKDILPAEKSKKGASVLPAEAPSILSNGILLSDTQMPVFCCPAHKWLYDILWERFVFVQQFLSESVRRIYRSRFPLNRSKMSFPRPDVAVWSPELPILIAPWKYF